MVQFPSDTGSLRAESRKWGACPAWARSHSLLAPVSRLPSDSQGRSPSALHLIGAWVARCSPDLLVLGHVRHIDPQPLAVAPP